MGLDREHRVEVGLDVGVYFPLKDRGVLETPEVHVRMKKQKALRSFPTKTLLANESNTGMVQ
jgi:hypothetical protein